jgi:DedD protein
MTAPGRAALAPAPAGSDPTKAAPPPAVEDLSYFNRLEKPSSPRDTAPPPRNASTPPAAASAPAPAAARAESAARTPSFVVQIAALNARTEADAMAKRVSSNGYQAYVQEPPNGTPNIFRVRVGPFKTRREADSAASKLKKELQLNPWVTQP